jgi:hypothetical protein
MNDHSAEELSEAHRAILSLRNKSEKASNSLKISSWQKRLTAGIVSASDVALSLIDGSASASYDQNTLTESSAALKDALRRAEEAIVKFTEGTSQHTLQSRRIAALKIALDLIEKAKSEI